MTRKELYHSTVPDIVNYLIPTKSDWSKVILQVVQTVEWIHRMYLTCSISRLSPMICHLCTYGTGLSIRYGNWVFWTRATWINRWGWLKRTYNNWAFWTRATWISRWGWLKRAYNNNMAVWRMLSICEWSSAILLLYHGDDPYAPWCSSGYRGSWILVISLTLGSPPLLPYFSSALILVLSACSRFH